LFYDFAVHATLMLIVFCRFSSPFCCFADAFFFADTDCRLFQLFRDFAERSAPRCCKRGGKREAMRAMLRSAGHTAGAQR
jgi:hypothetical protein